MDNAKDQETIDLTNEIVDTHYQNQDVSTTYSHASQGQRRNWRMKTANVLRWVSLPAEIRLMILELLAHENRGLASYAPVCKEWQAVIEKKNFGRLRLRTSCLDDFEHMVSRQRGLVKHIWLNIELRAYTCRSCQMTESFSWTSGNNAIIKRAISKLFSILSTWNPAGDGLKLEISARSPSDSEHWFKNYYFGADGEDEADISESGNQLQETTAKLHDPKHGWVDGQQVAAPDGFAVARLYGEVWLSSQGILPKVHAVTSFVIRRQCRRWFAPKTLWLLLDKLPRLECIVYEPWRRWYRMEQEMYDKEYKTMIEAHLPKGLKRISLFEDFNEDYTELFQGTASIFQVDPVRIAAPVVSAAFAYRSLDLEQLFVSFMVDARHFFQARQPLWTWNHLQSLVLTSRLLTHRANRAEISNLLQDAGAAALYMPRLHIMALWNCEKGEACVFVYRKECNNPSIIWRGTWDMKLESRVIQAWGRVASKYTPYELQVKSQPLRCGIISSHGEAIHQLALPRGVLDPVSLWQIRREGIGRSRT